jgi:hypothetical protein
MVSASHDAPALAGSAQPYTEVLPLHQRMRSQLSALRTHCQQAGIEPPVDQADVLTPAELLAVLQAAPAAGAADTWLHSCVIICGLQITLLVSCSANT